MLCCATRSGARRQRCYTALQDAMCGGRLHKKLIIIWCWFCVSGMGVNNYFCINIYILLGGLHMDFLSWDFTSQQLAFQRASRKLRAHFPCRMVGPQRSSNYSGAVFRLPTSRQWRMSGRNSWKFSFQCLCFFLPLYGVAGLVHSIIGSGRLFFSSIYVGYA